MHIHVKFSCSIEDAKNGIYNEDAWNALMPLSANDKKRHRMAYAYFAFAFIIFTAIIWLWKIEIEFNIVS